MSCLSCILYTQGCSDKKGVGTPFPHQIKRKTAQNSSIKVSILLQDSVLLWIFVFHCSFLTNSAILRVASTSVKSQPCFNVIVWVQHHHVTLPAQKGVGTRSHSKKGVGTPFPCVPTPLNPCVYAHLVVLEAARTVAATEKPYFLLLFCVFLL